MVVVEQEKKKMEGDDSLTALLTSSSLQPAFLLLSGLVSNPKARKKKKGRISKKRFRLRVEERLQTSIKCIIRSQPNSSRLFFISDNPLNLKFS